MSQSSFSHIQKAKPFIKWVGGKGQLLSTINMFLPANFHQLQGITYIEPFLGGGAMLFFMLQRFPNIKKAIVNDINPNLIRAYITVKHEPKALIKRLAQLQETYHNIKEENARKDFFLSARAHFNQGGLTNIENTALLIFLNKTCFNGLYRVNSKGLFNVPFGRYQNPTICDEKTLYYDSELLQRVKILEGDFEQIEVFAEEHSFVYLDPPYRPLDATSSFTSYAKESFNDQEQIRLKRFVDRLSAKGCWVMLSNSDGKARNPDDTFFDSLYKDYLIERIYASRSVNANPKKRGKLTELLIRNYAHTMQFSEHNTFIPFNTTLVSHEQSTYYRTI